MRLGGRLAVIGAGIAAGSMLVGACSSSGKAARHPTTTRAPRSSGSTAPTETSSSSVPSPRSTTTPTSTAPTTTTPGHALLQALLAQGRNANVKVVYDTPSGRVTLIRRDHDSVYADSSGVRFTLGSVSYDCTGAGDGATCAPVHGDATQSDIDVYTALVTDALGNSNGVTTHTTSVVGRTSECFEIAGRAAARAGTSINACVDDDTGVLLRYSTLGPPDPGAKLYAVSVGAPTDHDFQLPVPPSGP